jgi:hypothetical protein
MNNIESFEILLVSAKINERSLNLQGKQEHKVQTSYFTLKSNCTLVPQVT